MIACGSVRGSVLFAPAYRLVQELLAAKRDLDLPRWLRKLDNFGFLLLDDLGHLPQCQWRRHVGPLGRSKTVPPGVFMFSEKVRANWPA